eukprot:606692-Rhodomonas_salina.1
MRMPGHAPRHLKLLCPASRRACRAHRIVVIPAKLRDKAPFRERKVAVVAQLAAARVVLSACVHPHQFTPKTRCLFLGQQPTCAAVPRATCRCMLGAAGHSGVRPKRPPALHTSFAHSVSPQRARHELPLATLCITRRARNAHRVREASTAC